jgi:hypothetical protein
MTRRRFGNSGIVHDVLDPERALLAARLGDAHPSDRQRLERLTAILHRVAAMLDDFAVRGSRCARFATAITYWSWALAR